MKYLFLLGCSLVVSTPVLAAESDAGDYSLTRDVGITVVATGLNMPVDETGQSVSVIGADEMEAIQGPDLTRVLDRLPGVTYSRNGGLGGFTGVRIRGADSEQTLVLVDGVRVDDVSQPSGGFNFGNLFTGNIDKVELLRGSNSVVWGSQAIGGVVAITTRQLEGAEVSSEYGAYDSFYTKGAVGGTAGAFSGTLTGGYARSDGFSELSAGSEADGYRQWQVSGKGRVDLGSGLALTANGRFADTRRDIDDFSSDTSGDLQKTRDFAGHAALEYTSEPLELSGDYAHYDIHRSYEGPSYGGYSYNGGSEQAKLTGRWRITPAVALVFGADHEWSRFRSTFNTEEKARLASGHALLDFHSGPIRLAAGLRIDHHNRFGSEWSFGANGSVDIIDGWRVRASYGEGFKVPTLYQIFDPYYGNPALKPERSHSYDLGLEKGDRNGTLHFAFTVFRRDSRDLIDFISCWGITIGMCADHADGYYDNVGKARAEGMEVEADARPTDRLSLHAAYSYVKSVNRTPGDYNEGLDLPRRPRHAVSVSADWRTPLHDFTVGGDIRLVSKSTDSFWNYTRLDSYVLATLRASLPVTERIELFGRVENVTDEKYETAAGYGTPGRSAYFGARARF